MNGGLVTELVSVVLSGQSESSMIVVELDSSMPLPMEAVETAARALSNRHDLILAGTCCQ